MNYINRTSEAVVLEMMSHFPATAVVGPRQVGKTSMVKTISGKLEKPTLYLDLENPDDLIKLDNPGLFLDSFTDHTVILDEVQKLPHLFPVLRGIIDRNRQPGRFILLGSASPDLIRDSSETLAGRIAYHELPPFTLDEVKNQCDFKSHWLRGGFPDSLLAMNDQISALWRKNFIQTYLERDLPQLGLSADPVLLRRLWQMAAHLSGNLLNLEVFARSMGIHATTVRRYLDFMESAFLIRRLTPYFSSMKKRLVKSPKLYLRDTGILHQLLGIGSFNELSGHPVIGASWETYVLEQLWAILPEWAEICFYRTLDGAEVDLLVTRAGKPEILIEIKYSTTPKLSRGFHNSASYIGVEKQFVICPIDTAFPISESVKAVGLNDLNLLFED